MKDKKYIIGTNSVDYNPKRNFAGLPFKSFRVEKRLDLFRILDYIYFKFKHKSHLFFSNSFFDMGLNRVELYHFFNSVPFTSKPWVVTYENEVPRPYLQSKSLVKRLAKNNCKKIIAFCDRARAIETFLLEKYPEYKQQILDKLIVLQPSQQLHVNSIEEKEQSGPVVFTFVGVDFFRKGGEEVLNATEQLIEEGYDFRLNVVSKLQKGNWKDEFVTSSHIERAKNVIQKHSNIINYYYSLQGNEIITLFKKSHVGLLPSFGETYGYVVLEAQACGCPVITTDMPPFSEFNSNTIGWLIKVPTKERNGTFDSDLSLHNLELFQSAIRKGLYESMKEAILNRQILNQKAKNAILHIKENHSPEKNAAFLEEIYFNSLN